MPWELTNDVEVFAARAWDLLAADPVTHTVALTTIDGLRSGRRWSDVPPVLGWYADGDAAVTGAVCMTPPFELQLEAVPDGSLRALVDALRERGVSPGGASGRPHDVTRFAGAWTAVTGLMAETTMRQRLYAFDAANPEPPAPAGRARPARAEDVDLLVARSLEFRAEAGGHATDVEPVVRRRSADGLLWVWEDDLGTIVSHAGRSAAVAGVARVGPVYTPPEHRRCGYGTAVTAACTRDALRRDAAQVVLFTDLANPTSNAIYQQIGYRPVSDRVIVGFVAGDRG